MIKVPTSQGGDFCILCDWESYPYMEKSKTESLFHKVNRGGFKIDSWP